MNHETNGIEQIILQNLTSFFQAFHYRANKKNLKNSVKFLGKSKQISPGKVDECLADLTKTPENLIRIFLSAGQSWLANILWMIIKSSENLQKQLLKHLRK